ncbi:hypothetical protein BH09ACT7_BH09ACT7_32450 [soil metagenome]
MTENYADKPNAADARRASAITIHHRRGNREGISAILNETGEANRVTELFLAILGIHGNALTELRTDAGLNYIANFIQEIGGLTGATEIADPETLGGDVNRCCRLLDAHGRQDIPELNRALQDAFATRRTIELTIALLDIYELVLPELTSAAGIKWLEACINSFSAEEVQGP